MKSSAQQWMYFVKASSMKSKKKMLVHDLIWVITRKIITQKLRYHLKNLIYYVLKPLAQHVFNVEALKYATIHKRDVMWIFRPNGL